MKERSSDKSTTRIKLDNYGFAGMDASQLGAIKSVADFYQIPIMPTQIYGLTGLAFLHVLDESLSKPNIGPPASEIFRLARNFGVEIEGIYQFAEGETFSELQLEAWEKAKNAINSNKPVFAKNIAHDNQTSVIVGYDDIGYYIDSWHTGYQHSQDVISWNLLGLSRCPCINCVEERKVTEPRNITSGLISLHWAHPIAAAEELKALKDALQYVHHLNEIATYEEFGKSHFIGTKAYEEWINAIQRDAVLKFDFALVVEVLKEARYHAKLFLNDLKDKFNAESNHSIEEAIRTYDEIFSRACILNNKYPYEQPRELFSNDEKEDIITILKEISMLESEALAYLKEIYLIL